MPKRARVALKVTDLASSLTFYVDRLGLQLAESQSDADMPFVLDPFGDLILLAGPAVDDVKSHLDETYVVYKPGDTLDFSEEEENLDARLAVLTARGLTEIHLDMRSWLQLIIMLLRKEAEPCRKRPSPISMRR